MKSQPAPITQLLDKHGNPVRVKKVPMSTGKKKFKNATKEMNALSPFERFGKFGGSKVTSF